MATALPADFAEFLNVVRWALLSHAYGPASDAPVALRALLEGNDREKADAVDYLQGAVAHQGTLYLATAPVAVAVASILLDPRLAKPVDHWTDLVGGRLTLRSHLLSFLATVAEGCRFEKPRLELEATAHPPGRDDEVTALALSFASAKSAPETWSDEVLANAYMARSILACRDACPRVVDPVFRCLDDPNWEVRVYAADCCAKLVGHPDLLERRPELASRLEQMATRGERVERAALVLSLGHIGVPPLWFLNDPDQAVRVSAAVAPSLLGDSAARKEILSALADPAGADGWLPPLPQLKGRLRFSLVREAVKRVGSFEELLPAAIAVAGMTSRQTVDGDWGPLLAAAFPTPLRRPPGLTAAQRSFLAALLENSKVWEDERYANPRRWLEGAGLPYKKEALRQLLDEPEETV